MLLPEPNKRRRQTAGESAATAAKTEEEKSLMRDEEKYEEEEEDESRKRRSFTGADAAKLPPPSCTIDFALLLTLLDGAPASLDPANATAVANAGRFVADNIMTEADANADDVRCDERMCVEAWMHGHQQNHPQSTRGSARDIFAAASPAVDNDNNAPGNHLRDCASVSKLDSDYILAPDVADAAGASAGAGAAAIPGVQPQAALPSALPPAPARAPGAVPRNSNGTKIMGPWWNRTSVVPHDRRVLFTGPAKTSIIHQFCCFFYYTHLSHPAYNIHATSNLKVKLQNRANG